MPILKKNQTLIFIFVEKIIPKNMQDLIFFFKNENFNLKRTNKNYNKKFFLAKTLNANFVLESNNQICNNQLQKLIFFLNKHTKINIIFFKNKILNGDRFAKIKEEYKSVLFQEVNSLIL